MANVDPSVIRTLLDDIERLRKTIIGFTGSRSSRLEDSKLDKVRAAVLGGAAQFDSVQWCRLSERDKRNYRSNWIAWFEIHFYDDALLDVARRRSR